MFEKRKTSNIPILVIAVIMLVSGFYIGKVLENKEDKETEKVVKTVNATNDIKENEFELKKDAKINFKTMYSKCPHIKEKEEVIGSDYVGLNESKLKERIKFDYPGWKIIEFGEKEIVLLKKIDSYCDNHYEIGEESGFIVIYKYENGEKVVVDKTDNSTKDLPDIDQEQIKKGIVVESLEKVNEMLEDFVS